MQMQICIVPTYEKCQSKAPMFWKQNFEIAKNMAVENKRIVQMAKVDQKQNDWFELGIDRFL